MSENGEELYLDVIVRLILEDLNAENIIQRLVETIQGDLADAMEGVMEDAVDLEDILEELPRSQRRVARELYNMQVQLHRVTQRLLEGNKFSKTIALPLRFLRLGFQLLLPPVDQAQEHMTRLGITVGLISRLTQTMLSIVGKSFKMLISSSPELNALLTEMGYDFQIMGMYIGDALAPIIETTLLPAVENMTDSVTNASTETQTFIGVMLGATTGAIGLGVVLASLGASFGAVIVVVGGLIAIIGVLAGIWIYNFGHIRDITKEVFDYAKMRFEQLGIDTGELGKGFKVLAVVIYRVFNGIFIFLFKSIGGFVKGVIDFIYLMILGFKTFFGGIVDMIRGIVHGDFQLFLKGMKELAMGILEILGAIPSIFYDTVIGMLEGLAEAFKEWGWDAGSEFIDGIIQAIKDGADSVAEAISDYLGFSLPKKGLLRQVPVWGRDMAEQYFSKGFFHQAQKELQSDRMTTIQKSLMNITTTNQRLDVRSPTIIMEGQTDDLKKLFRTLFLDNINDLLIGGQL